VCLVACGALLSCGRGATDATPPLPLTTVTRVDVQLAADTVLVGDSVSAGARAVNREGTVLSLATIVWSTADSSIVSVTPDGVLRARNVGSVRVEAVIGGTVGSRTVRVVTRPIRVRILAPDTAQLSDEISVRADVETTTGVALPAVGARLSVSDTSVATLAVTDVGRARLVPLRPGALDLLAVVGRDTTRRRFVLRFTPLRSLSVTINARVVGVGDSVPVTITAIDSAGRSVPTGGTLLGFEPAGTMLLRNGHLLALTFGRVIVRAQNGVSLASDTLTAQSSSEFPLDLVDGDGQRPLPLKVLLSMERVAQKWRSVIRTAPPGDFVNLRIGECRNAVPVSQFITGVRVLIKLDTLPARLAGLGGPCVVRPNGLPLVGTISLNIFNYNTLPDRKLDDLIQHEVGHVLGLGTIWNRGTFSSLVNGDSASADPIFVGPNALAAFTRLGRSTQFAGRRVPIQLGALGHWRIDAFGGELMAPALSASAQPTSAVTVAALRDLGWAVEPEAYEEYSLPDAVVSGGATPRVQSTAPLLMLDGDLLPPQLMIQPGGRKVRLDARGRPILR
jgi:Leishmanolysin